MSACPVCGTSRPFRIRSPFGAERLCVRCRQWVKGVLTQHRIKVYR